MGFLKRFLSPSNGIKTLIDPAGQTIRTIRGVPTTPGTMLNPMSGETESERNAAWAEEHPTYGPPGLPGSGLGNGGLPAQNQPPLQLPQLGYGQMPQMLPNPQGFAQGQGQGMPYVRDRAFAQTLAPFFQPNYGVPFISPYGQQGQGGGLGTPGMPGPPGAMPYQPPPPQTFPGLGRIGLQPIRGGYG